MTRFFTFALVLLSAPAAALLISCGDDGESSGDAGCNLGDTRTCRCDDGALGGRVCGDDGEFGSCQCGGTETQCDNGVDDDFDGLRDCMDSDCADEVVCGPDFERDCGDEIDDDGDGRTDCEDPDCRDNPFCAPTAPPPEICDDLMDNDRDGMLDCSDPDCELAPNCVDFEICDNEVDDDDDGDIDCDDDECADNPACIDPEVCDDEIDNDNDGAVDCADSDCENVGDCPGCGNGNVDPGEACDGDAFANGLTCEDFGFLAGDLTCDDTCMSVSTASCLTAECGNDDLEEGELCDGDNLPEGAACTDSGFDEGDLLCAEGCQTFDTSSCGHTGDRTDGICSMPVDLDAVTPEGDPPRRSVEESLDDTAGNDAGSCGGDMGRDVVYVYTAPADGMVSVAVTTAADESYAVYVRADECDQANEEIVCGTDMVTFEATMDSVYHIFVDALEPEQAGMFTLELEDPVDPE